MELSLTKFGKKIRKGHRRRNRVGRCSHGLPMEGSLLMAGPEEVLGQPQGFAALAAHSLVRSESSAWAAAIIHNWDSVTSVKWLCISRDSSAQQVFSLSTVSVGA